MIKNSLLVLAGATLLASSFASAAMITGSIAYEGDFTFVGGTNFQNSSGLAIVSPVTDFVATGVLGINDMNTDGVMTASGFTWTPPGAQNPAISSNPLWTLTNLPDSFWFEVETLEVDYQFGPIPGNVSGLGLSGTGTLYGVGYDPTPATWTFTGDSAGSMVRVFSSDTFAEPIPEPSTILGLISLAIVGTALALRLRARR